MKGGIKVNDFQGLQEYISKSLIRCKSNLDPDRRDEIEEFLFREYWRKGKPIPTKIVIKGREIRDPAVKWALRKKLKDAGFRNRKVSTVKNEDGEEIDVFECIGENDRRYTEVEQWHDICRTVGVEPARAILFGLYEEQSEEKDEQEREDLESRQGVLWE